MTHAIDEVIFHVSSVLEVPVLLLALLALAATLFELGSFSVELSRRRRRHAGQLSTSTDLAKAAFMSGDLTGVDAAFEKVGFSSAAASTLRTMVSDLSHPLAEQRLAKALADFDFDAQRRLARTRLLVRLGPALGLMGTLIPLSPALDGLAHGNITELSSDLRVAFSVTVLGLLIGALAFAVSLSRDRLYGQDLSDLEYVGAVFTSAPPSVVTPSTESPS